MLRYSNSIQIISFSSPLICDAKICASVWILQYVVLSVCVVTQTDFCSSNILQYGFQNPEIPFYRNVHLLLCVTLRQPIIIYGSVTVVFLTDEILF